MRPVGSAQILSDVAKRLLTIEDLADYLRTSTTQVRNMRSRGQLPPAVKIPGIGLRWREEDLEAWIAASAENGADEGDD